MRLPYDAENPRILSGATADKLKKLAQSSENNEGNRQSVVDLYDMLAEETEDPDLTALSSFSPIRLRRNHRIVRRKSK